MRFSKSILILALAMGVAAPLMAPVALAQTDMQNQPPPPGYQSGYPPGPPEGVQPSGPDQQQAPGGPPAPRARHANKFDEANVTHDGKLTKDQAQAANWRRVVKDFELIDRDHKGYVTKQDMRAFKKDQAAARAPAQ